jgi:nucleotide-binding universal stress UspA family protein
MYRVVYQTDLHATSTRRAAREAWQTIKESDGPILHVIDHDGNVVDEDLEVLGEGEREEQE